MRLLWTRFGGHSSRREQWLILATSLMLGLFWAGIHTWWSGLAHADHQIYGTWISLAPRSITDRPGVMLIPITPAEKHKYGFPLPRELYGRLLRRLIDAGVTTVAFDLFFEEAGPTAAGDFDLESTFEETCLCLAYRFRREGAQVTRVLPHVPLIDGFSPVDLEPRLGFSVQGRDSEVKPVWLKLSAHNMKPPNGLPNSGFASRPPAAVQYGLPVVALAHDLGITPGELVLPVRHYLTDDFIDGIHVEAGHAWLNPHSVQHLPSVSLSEWLETPLEELKGTVSAASRSGRLIALVGDSEAGRRHSLAGPVSDLEIQGFTIVNLVRNNFLVPVGLAGLLAVTVATALAVGLIGSLLNLLGACLGTLLLAAGLVALNCWALTEFGLMLPLVAPLLAAVSAYGAAASVQLRSSGRHRQRVLTVARECCPVDPRTPPEGSRLLTLLLWDLRGYGHVDPALLVEYFTLSRQIIDHFEGVVLDFTDSNMVVIFGLAEGSHALPACRAAAGLVAEAQLRRLPPTRICLATGEGEVKRLAGRNVLTGIAVRSARLATLARIPDWEVRLTPATWMACQGNLPALAAGSARVPLYVLRVQDLVRELKLSGGAFPWHPKSGKAGPPELTLGGHFKGYRLDRVLGEGGMGRVFQAEDTRLLRKVALKVVIGSLREGQSRRFLKEARAVARVHHPSIVAIYEFGLEPFPYIVMEYVPGQDLSGLVEHQQPWAWTVDVIARVLDALAVVHGQGIIHRDLKPSNIMVTAEGQVKMMDFGLARFTEESTRISLDGQICGTPRYMAPEHMEDDFGEVDAISDLYAVAVSFYELLTGVSPVHGDTVPTIIYDLIYGQPTPAHEVNPEVPEDVSRVCMKGLEKQKADRFQSAQEFATALRSCRSVRGGPEEDPA